MEPVGLRVFRRPSSQKSGLEASPRGPHSFTRLLLMCLHCAVRLTLPSPAGGAAAATAVSAASVRLCAWQVSREHRRHHGQSRVCASVRVVGEP